MFNVATSACMPARTRPTHAFHQSWTPEEETKRHSDEEYEALLDNLFYFWDPNPEFGPYGASERVWMTSGLVLEGHLECQVEGCFASFFSEASQSLHMTLHPVYKCERCPEIITAATLFIIRQTKPDGSAAGLSYVCAKCNQTYYSRSPGGGGPPPCIIVLDDD